MLNVHGKRKPRLVLSRGQHRLLRDSLKRILGPGLLNTPPRRTEREERALFLRNALNSKILEEEWLS